MKINVPFKNPRTNEIKSVKVGWSWTLLSFSGILGIPLFLRKLNSWGFVFLIVWLASVIVPNSFDKQGGLGLGIVLLLISLVMTFWIAAKGNEMTAKNYLDLGWTFAEPDSEATRFGKLHWGMPNQT